MLVIRWNAFRCSAGFLSSWLRWTILAALPEAKCRKRIPPLYYWPSWTNRAMSALWCCALPRRDSWWSLQFLLTFNTHFEAGPCTASKHSDK